MLVFQKAKLILISCLSLILLTGQSFSALTQEEAVKQTIQANIEIRKITPPKLEAANIANKILCHRPMRKSAPAMYVEQKDNVIIAHNYGHGGSGWTLAPAAASHVNGLLVTELGKNNLDKETPITIIGAGVLSLFTALDLSEQGYTNITIKAKSFDNLASHNAGGLLAPASMSNDAKTQSLIDELCIKAYHFYHKIALGQHKILKKGIKFMPAYFLERANSGLEPYVDVVMKPAKDVMLDFGNGTKRAMVAYDDAIFMDTPRLMKDLKAALEGKATFIQEEIKDFAQIKTPVIINCSGLGAKVLNSDAQMISVQGHLITLKAQKVGDFNHMILLYPASDAAAKNSLQSKDIKDSTADHNIKRLFYMIPKSLYGTDNAAKITDIGVIGGTFIEGADSTTPNTAEFDAIINRAREFYGIK